MKMSNQKEIELNLPQFAVISLSRQMVYNPLKKRDQYVKKIVLEWARGTGKSTILGWFIKEAVSQMPRATGVLVGETYQQILSRTLPSTKEGLDMFGILEDIDYIVGRSGKDRGFTPPFQAPSSWGNVIHFSNGFILIMVSNDQPNAGRGINSSFAIGDEAALLDKERLYNNVQTTNRSTCGGLYASKPLCNTEVYASSVAMTKKGQWFTDLEKEAEKFPWKVLFIKANSFANKMNLSKEYFESMRDNAPSITHYNAEILNIRPKAVTRGFYPALDPKKHYYKYSYDNNYLNDVGLSGDRRKFNCNQDTDYVKGKRLVVTIDWGNIITMNVSQDQTQEYRFLKTFFVETPKIIDDIIEQDFCPYYEPLKASNNTIEFYFDRNGNSKVANSRITFAEQAGAAFKRNGWKVIFKTHKHENPPHNEKYIVLNYLLKYGGTNGLPLIKINEHNCNDMIISLENAPAIDGTQANTLQKDKRSERSKVIKQQHATHFSDTFDIPLYFKFRNKVMRLLDNRDDRDILPIFSK